MFKLSWLGQRDLSCSYACSLALQNFDSGNKMFFAHLKVPYMEIRNQKTLQGILVPYRTE